MSHADPVARKAYNVAYQQKHRERLAAQHKAYEAAHRAEINAGHKKWNDANSEKCKASSRKRYEKNKERRLARVMQRRKENWEAYLRYVREYRKRSPVHAAYVEATREKDNARRREVYRRNREFYREYYNLVGHRSPRKVVIWIKWETCEKLCYICGKGLAKEDMHVDHVLAIKNGGTNDIANLMPTHEFCNKAKSHKLNFPIVRPDLVELCSPIQAHPRNWRRLESNG